MREEWHKLVEDNRKWVHWIINRYFPFIKRMSQLDYEEAVAEGNLALVRAAKKYHEQNDMRPFINYATNAILNAVRQLHRSETRMRNDKNKTVSLESVVFNQAVVDESITTLDDIEYCNNIISKCRLPEQVKIILIMFYWDGMSYEQISNALTIKKDDVGNALQLARNKMRALCVK